MTRSCDVKNLDSQMDKGLVIPHSEKKNDEKRKDRSDHFCAQGQPLVLVVSVFLSRL